MMQAEYVITVGNTFLKDMHEWGEGQIVLTPNQKDAKRFTDDVEMKKAVAKVELYKMPYVLLKVNIAAEVIVVVPNLVKEAQIADAQ